MQASQQAFKLATGREEEIGVKQSLWDHRLDWTFAGYRIVKNNLLTPSLANPNVSEEVGQQSSRGVEASLAVKLAEHWHVEGNGTLLKAKFDNYSATVNSKVVSLDGLRPYMVPEQTANAWLTWDFAADWQARTGLQYVGKRFSDNEDTGSMPAYTVVGLGARWTPTPNLKFDLRADNIFNKVYAESAPSGNTSQWFLGEPRSVTGTVSVAF
jgi:iron complex outermembrane receptor protein